MTEKIGAIDVGTTRIKGMVFGSHGRPLTITEEDMPPLVVDGLSVTQDLAKIEAAFALVHKRVEDADLIAITTQRGTGIALDANRHATGPLISWADRRPRASLVGPGGVRSLHAHLFARLTGRPFESVQTGVASPAVEMAPIGTVEGKYVVAGGDKNSELVGAGIQHYGQYCLSLGTALSLGTLIEKNRPSPAGAYRTPSHYDGLDQIELGLPLGGEIIPYIRRTLGKDIANQAASHYPTEDGPIFMPYFAGSLSDPNATPRWIGKTDASTAKELATGALAGVVLDLMHQVQALPDHPHRVTVVGGWSRHVDLVQWISDALFVPIMMKERPDSGCNGAAVVAAGALARGQNWVETAGGYVAWRTETLSPRMDRQKVWTRLLERFRAELGCNSGTQKL